MELTERDADILAMLVFVGFATTPQIRREHFPKDKDGSVVRDRMRKLEAGGYVVRRRAEVANPLQSSTMPVWIITPQALSTLAVVKGDPTYLNLHPPCTRAWQNFCHYACVTAFALLLRRVIAAQTYVKLHAFHCEHTILNPDASAPGERYKLYTDVSAESALKKLVCAPDAAFEIEVQGYRRAYYLELERGFDMPARVIAKKGQGFAGLAETQKWKRHFPEAKDFRALALTPSAGWRDALRKCVRDYKKGAELWMFAAEPELTEENLLHGLAFYTATEGPKALIKPPAGPP